MILFICSSQILSVGDVWCDQGFAFLSLFPCSRVNQATSTLFRIKIISGNNDAFYDKDDLSSLYQ